MEQTITASGSQGQASEASAGLVPYTTSDTLVTLSQFLYVSAKENRLKRMKHHVRTASRLVRETMHRRGRKWRAVFVTLTYRPGVHFNPRHVSDFLKNVREWGRRQGFAVPYVWVAEMQQRQAVHYHLVLWLPSSVRLPRPDRRGWWRHGSSNTQAVKRNAVGYLMKYVSKGVGDTDTTPDLPKGARICGSGGLDRMAKDEFHYWRLPRYVRDNLTIGERCTRAEGGGWMHKGTGELYRTEWGIWGFGYKSQGLDCNGRTKRPVSVAILSDKYKRVKASVLNLSQCLSSLSPSIIASSK